MDKELSLTLPGPSSQSTRIPLLVEMTFNASQVVIVVVTLATAILSFFAKADVITITFRTIVALIAVGIPVVLLNWMLGRYFINATVEEWKSALNEKKEKASESDVDSGELEASA
jgi:hydrogenase-4 membrane subunit HyfE